MLLVEGATMDCTKCGTENGGAAKFCATCGAWLMTARPAGPQSRRLSPAFGLGTGLFCGLLIGGLILGFIAWRNASVQPPTPNEMAAVKHLRTSLSWWGVFGKGPQDHEEQLYRAARLLRISRRAYLVGKAKMQSDPTYREAYMEGLRHPERLCRYPEKGG